MPAQLVELRLVIEFSNCHQAKQATMRLEVSPIVMLHRMFVNKAKINGAHNAAGVYEGKDEIQFELLFVLPVAIVLLFETR